MAKRTKRIKRLKRRASAKWTDEERQLWLAFLQGDLWFPPSQRPIAAVVNRLRGFAGLRKERKDTIMPSLESIPQNVRHAMSIAAMAALTDVPHMRESQLRDQSEAICRIACGDVSFIVNADTGRHVRAPSDPNLFGMPEPEPGRHVVFDLPDETLHMAIIITRRVMRAIAKVKTRARA